MERERIMSIVQTIFFCQLRTTASGTDTTLSVIDTEYGISGFFQFIIMTFRGQFFFCILGQIKGNRLLVIYGQFPAVISNTDNPFQANEAFLPRLGIRLFLSKRMNQAEYFGYGRFKKL